MSIRQLLITATSVILRLIGVEMISTYTAVAGALVLIYCGTAKSTNPEILVQILRRWFHTLSLLYLVIITKVNLPYRGNCRCTLSF
jgi:hypothetical protein